MTQTVSERLRGGVEPFRKMLDNFSSSLRVAAPGIIKTFDAAKQTCTVELAIREKINNGTEFEDIAIPILLDVPVMIMGGGGFTATFPIAAGDECLVVFGDNCMDAWWESSKVSNQIDKRRHDLSDGFAIIGPRSQPKVVSGYSADSVQIRNSTGAVMVEVKSDVVNIGGDTFRKLIDERLLDAFNNHVHATAATGPPSTPTTPLVLANIATTKTKAG